MTIKIGTWNLCLGLQCKKDIVIKELTENQIDICCVQETELDANYPTNILSSASYEYEPEKNSSKKRVGIYINNKLSYQRREDLEEEDFHIVIIDLILDIKVRILTLYRSFRPPNSLSPSVFFKKQLDIIERNIVPNMIVLGDFNLDAKMQFRLDYPHKVLFDELNSLINRFNLDQLVDFPTYSTESI